MLREIKGYLFDLDGVLWLGKNQIPGVKETLDTLRHWGKKLMFVSNTSSRSRQDCLIQFVEMGIPIASEELFIASEETAKHLARLKPEAKVCALGGRGLFEELERFGLLVSAPELVVTEEFDFLVIGKDKTINYDKLAFAFNTVRAGAQLVAVNCDPVVPGNNGLEPGAGALVATVASMIGRPADITVGKPGTLLLELALAQSGLKAEECVMIGDTLEADIVAGNRLGMKTVLVLTGNASKGDLINLPQLKQPDIVLDSVRDLVG